MTEYFTTPDMASDITSILRRRGLEPKRVGNITETLYPEDDLISIIERHGQLKYQEYFPGPEHFSDYYLDLFGIASFRKMVKRLLRDDQSPAALAELEQIAGGSTKRYVEFLDRSLLVERTETTVRLTRQIPDLGRSLEHYVAQMCIKKLRGSAEWGVLLENLPRSGGDYDVLAWLEPSLLYVECKSGSERNITDNELKHFLQRSVELAPDLAILLIDTDENLDRFVEDRINTLLRQAVDVRGIANQRVLSHPDYPGIYYGFSRIYVTNSKKVILRQLQKCLQHYYAHVKGLALWSKPYLSNRSINFTNAPLHEEEDGLSSENT